MARLVARGIVQIQYGQLMIWSESRTAADFPEWTDEETAAGRCQAKGFIALTTLVPDGLLLVSLFDHAPPDTRPQKYDRLDEFTFTVREALHVGSVEITDPMLTAAWASGRYLLSVGQKATQSGQSTLADLEVHIFAALIHG